MIPKNKLNKLRRDLSGVSMKPLAEKIGKTEVAIFNVLRGATYNEETLIALIDYRDELRAKQKSITDRI